MADKFSVLKQYYGYDSFRSGQEPVIDHILAGRDVLAVMPTGAGKSICYQIPAVLMPGITLVISPLISLMKDQVGALNQNGIRAAYLNSSLSARQFSMALANAKAGVYKIIYVAPERLLTDSFLDFASAVHISLVAVDEAHCVSQWGHDFRTSYTHIADFVSRLPHRPVLAAFTATATELVKADVRALLSLRDPFEITTGFDRPNLYFGVADSGNRVDYICDYLNTNPERSGIIYAMTRKNVEMLHARLTAKGFPVTLYHAGLSDGERAENQDAFIRDVKPVMIATNAFGMGIDKPDVAFIIHYNLPLSMEAYYQEAGRAGRDGSEADCILLYSPADIHTAKFLIENGSDEDEAATPEEIETAKRSRYQKLEHMISYCKTTDCLRSFILRYFGEKTDGNPCGKCSSCRSEYEQRDVTDIVHAVYMAVDVTGERFGMAFVTDFLHGDDNGRMDALGFTEERGFGILQHEPVNLIRDVIMRMVDAGLLRRSEGQYPTLSIDASLDRFVKSKQRLTVKRAKEKPKKAKSAKSAPSLPEYADPVIYEALRKYRREMADKRSVPAYVIFTDAALKEIAAKQPKNIFELMNVRGIGAQKAEKYGKDVIDIVMKNS
ncbi:MAG: DNA helicase RecQ [Ruminococcaceae bacterium]|nr:DNA helicase RecQ [Oscillospiraceae bacterium]